MEWETFTDGRRLDLEAGELIQGNARVGPSVLRTLRVAIGEIALDTPTQFRPPKSGEGRH